MGLVHQIRIFGRLHDSKEVSVVCLFNINVFFLNATFLIYITSGNESLGMIFPAKGEMVSSENITSTNEVSIMPILQNKQFTSTPKSQHQYQQNESVIIHPIRHSNNMSRSSQSTPSPSTTTANITAETSAENIHLNPIIKMEVPDDDEDDNDDGCMEPKICENGNFNYVGEYIAAELNKLPLREAFMLKNILIREVLTFTERVVLAREKQ